MIYLTGRHALNLPCSLSTTGDWHRGCLDWTKLETADSDNSILQDYGIEHNCYIPWCKQYMNKANHIRALLDLIVQNRLLDAQGMKNDFICCDDLTPQVFNKVILFKELPNWANINSFMYHEYKREWREFLESVGIPLIADANFRVNRPI